MYGSVILMPSPKTAHLDSVLYELERSRLVVECPLQLGGLHEDPRGGGGLTRACQQLPCPLELVVLRLQLDGGQPDLLRVRVGLEGQREDGPDQEKQRNIGQSQQLWSTFCKINQFF